MANFSFSNTPRPLWLGGPAATCSICKFVNHAYEWFLIFDTVDTDMELAMPGQATASSPVHLCPDHAAELKSKLEEVLPDTKLPALQGKLLKAEAARAKAEKRAELAEAALHAMQDWITGSDEAK